MKMNPVALLTMLVATASLAAIACPGEKHCHCKDCGSGASIKSKAQRKTRKQLAAAKTQAKVSNAVTATPAAPAK